VARNPRFGYYIILSNLLEHYEVRRYTKDTSMLYFVADSGLPNLTRIQVHKTPDINVRGGGRHKTPLSVALHNANENVFRAILNHWTIHPTKIDGASNVANQSALQIHSEALEFLREHREHIAKGGVEELLSYAVQRNRRASVGCLLGFSLLTSIT
jgi:hypothetical protein